jgi:hypothetical protein
VENTKTLHKDGASVTIPTIDASAWIVEGWVEEPKLETDEEPDETDEEPRLETDEEPVLETYGTDGTDGTDGTNWGLGIQKSKRRK